MKQPTEAARLKRPTTRLTVVVLEENEWA